MVRKGKFSNILTVGALMAAVTGQGCARPVPMDPRLPVSTTDGYRQNGQRVHWESVMNELAEEPASKVDAGRARTLAVISMTLGLLGGVLIGRPLGEKLAGQKNPQWELAIAGGAATTIALPLGYWGDVSLKSAVDSHNRGLPSARR